jgi:basic amino acid/polyamine antiporter, APA family
MPANGGGLPLHERNRSTAGEPGLRRTIGFFGLLAFSVGINIGAGLFVLVNVAGSITGPSMPVAMLIGAVPAVLALVPYTMLARGYPTTSATYRYAKLLDPRLAFVVLTIVVIAILIGGQPLFALAAGEYLNELIPVSPLLIGAVAITLFYVVNVLGVRPTVVVQVVLMVALIAALVLFVVTGTGSIESENLSPFLPEGAVGLFVAAGLLFALMAGGLFIVDVGDEVVEPMRIYRRVLPLGMAVVVVLYVFITLITAGAVPYAQLEDETLVTVAEEFMGPAALGFFIVGGALVAAVTTMNVTFTLVARGMLVVARDGLLPQALGRTGRFASPVRALTVAYLISIAAFFAQLPPRFMGAVLNMGLLLAITLVALAALRVPERHPEIYEPSRATLPVSRLRLACRAVIVLNTLIFLLLVAATPAALTVLVPVLTGAWVYRRSREPTSAARPVRG